MHKGFTLIELLVTVAILVIVLALAVPSFQELIGSNRLATQVNGFLAHMNLARSEAAKRGTRVSVCASDPAASGNGSQTLCTGAWNAGWIVFTDTNGNCAIDSGVDEKLQVYGSLVGSTFTAKKQSDSTAVSCVGYSSRGFSVNDTDTIEFALCAPSVKKSRILRLAPGGRISKTDSTCS